MERLKEYLMCLVNNNSVEGRKKLFTHIWKAYYKRMYVYVRNMVKDAEHMHIEDLVQEIMTKVYRNLETYDTRYALSTWIYTIAHNHCIDFFRKSKAILDSLEEYDGITENSDPVYSVLRGDMQRTMEAVFKTLKEKEREIAFLYFFENMSYKQISRIMNMPEGTLRYTVFSVKKALKPHLEEYV